MTSSSLWNRGAGRDASLRAADADRERIAERLRTCHAEGRLDMAEFQERLERCYEARTFGELDELVGDLPRPQEPEPHNELRRLRLWRLGSLAPIVIALILVSAATGHHVFWPWIALGFFLWRFSWRRRRRWASGRRGAGDWL